MQGLSDHWPLPSPTSVTSLGLSWPTRAAQWQHPHLHGEQTAHTGIDKWPQLSSCMSSISLYEALLGSGLDLSCISMRKAGHGRPFPSQDRLDGTQALASLLSELSVCSGKSLSPSSSPRYPEIADTPGPMGHQPGAWPRDSLPQCWPSQQCLQKYTMFQAGTVSMTVASSRQLLVQPEALPGVWF